MGRHPTVSNQVLIQTFSRNHNYAETAELVGLHHSTVRKRLTKLKINGSKTAVMEQAGTLVAHGVDAFEQIIKINNNANTLLDTLIAEDLLSKTGAQCAECGTDVPRVLFDGNNNRKLAVKVMAEIRGQLKSQLDYLNCLYDMKASAEFQKAVIDSIGECAPDVKRTILDKLQGDRAIRSSVQFN